MFEIEKNMFFLNFLVKSVFKFLKLKKQFSLIFFSKKKFFLNFFQKFFQKNFFFHFFFKKIFFQIYISLFYKNLYQTFYFQIEKKKRENILKKKIFEKF